jgi:RNA polymerase sigma-70 factor (ECF subfamily)
VFGRGHSHRETQHDRDISPLLIVTAKNHCRNLLKHWWRRRRADPRELPETADRNADAPIGVLANLLALPEKYKTVLYLHYFAGYTTKELARMLKRNESTIRTQLARGRERLKIDLEENSHA